VTDIERRKLAKAFFEGLEEKSLSGGEVFARVLQDPEAFECAVSINKLQELVPELKTLQENLPATDPNFYRPMPVMQHMLESVRQAFIWIGTFGAEEYKGDAAKRNALLWINTALLFHDQGEIAIIKGTNLPLWYRFTVDWTKKRRKNIIRETYPFFGIDTPEGRSYINHLRHPEISAVLAAVPLTRLGWDLPAIKVVQFLIRNHSALIEQATYGRLKDGRVLHEDLYKDIVSVSEETGVYREDLLKMLQAVQIMDAKAVKSDIAQIPQETMMRVWMAYSYMNIVLEARNTEKRLTAFRIYRKEFSKIRKEMPYGTPFKRTFEELLCRVGEKEGRIPEENLKLLEQELEHFERFEVIRQDHIHINNQFNQLLHLIERSSGKELSPKERAVLLQAYKIAYRSHDGQFRRAFKNIPTGDRRRKYIEHPITVARIMVKKFGITDPLMLAAVLFHDVLEDTEIHVDDIPSAFKNDDEKGRIIKAITLLTKPETRKSLKGSLPKELAYLSYMAGIMTAGDTVLDDPELFRWLYYLLPRTKAADKIHNRRSLSARKPEGRIKEICRNGNTLLMFMESSNLTPPEKLRLLEEYDRSFFEIFKPLDFSREENARKFREHLSGFQKFLREQAERIYEKQTEKPDALREFEAAIDMLLQHPPLQGSIPAKLKELEKDLPNVCAKMDLSPEQAAGIADEFALFLFNISEVCWLEDEGKRKVIRFQTVIRRYKEKLARGDYEPEPARMIEALTRYAQGDAGQTPPIVRFHALPDVYEFLSRIPFLHKLYDRPLAMRKRRLVARLLPRVAMLPVKDIYWLQGNEVRSMPRAGVEKMIGGIRIEKTSGRIAINAGYHACFPAK
jgi:hypothetical protein